MSCSRENEDEVVAKTPFNEPSSSVMLYTEDNANAFVNSVTENEVSLSPNTPADMIPKVGSILQKVQ